MRINRRSRTCLAVVVVIAAVSASSIQTAAASPKDLTVTTTATAINDFVDVGPDGPSPGDIYVFVEDVFGAGSTKIGSAEGRCNLIDPTQARFECATITTLPRGSIATEGILVNQIGATSVGVITGGTGVYAGALGEAALKLGGPAGPHEVSFHFTGPA